MTDHDEIMAKMREALDKKKSNDSGVDEHGHPHEQPHKTQGPQGGVHLHRRKAGGGGS
jgi:hypothetical protein